MLATRRWVHEQFVKEHNQNQPVRSSDLGDILQRQERLRRIEKMLKLLLDELGLIYEEVPPHSRLVKKGGPESNGR